MTNDADLLFTPAYRLREMIAARELSPVELVEACLRQIDRLNPQLNAFLAVTADEAMTAARAAEQAVANGGDLGPLHGVPISIKDLEAVRGVRFTKGSLPCADNVATEDALVVERLRAAGAIIVGKTNTPEFGRLGLTENRLGDACRNPWRADTGAGGSSGGAAASVAAGMNPVAQGSDGGGSIRIPSSFCGVYGIKATQGRVPRRAEGPRSWHPVNFSCVGPMARTVRDAAIALQAMAGPAPDAEPGTIADSPPDFLQGLGTGVKGVKIGFTADFGSAAVDREVRAALERAAQVFEDLGAVVAPAPFEVDVERLWETYNTHARVRCNLSYGHVLDEHPDEVTDYVRADIEGGRAVTVERYYDALAELNRYRAYVSDYFAVHDLLLSPTLATPAFPVGKPPSVIEGRAVATRWGYYPFTFLFNMCGNPAASAPCGFSSGGLPIGLQIVGRRGDEQSVLRASAAFEEARPWAAKRPPVS